MMHKIRQIVTPKSKSYEVFGVTIPAEIAIFFREVFFSIEKSGTCIIMKSGANIIPSKEEIKQYKFEECRI